MGNSRDETGKTGSGFFVAQDIIATNLHVIKNSDEGVVKIVGQQTLYEILGVVGVDEKNDLALLKVAKIRGRAMSLNYDDSTAIGDEVYAVGSPQGLEGTFSQGIVSSIRKSSKQDLIQITAPISEGSSGGAVLNDRGEVVGVAVGAIESGQSLNFAIPVSFLRALISNQKPLVAIKGFNTVANNKAQTGSNRVRQPPKKIPTINTFEGTCLGRFKKPDLVEENVLGNVMSIKELEYIPERKFDEWVLGEVVSSQTHRYNSHRYIEYTEGTIYSEEGTGSGELGLFLLAIRGKEFPIVGKHFYYYDYSNSRITEETYLKCADCTSFQLDNKIVVKCENDVESRFDPDGKLFLKTIVHRGKDGKTTELRYNGDGTLWSKDVVYQDKLGEIKESWRFSEVNKDLLDLSSKTVTTETKEQLKETYNCIKEEDPMCGRVSILDKSTKLILRLEYGTTVLKYDYEFDSNGNWTKQTESQQVKKFGKTYFEPSKIKIREITYY